VLELAAAEPRITGLVVRAAMGSRRLAAFDCNGWRRIQLLSDSMRIQVLAELQSSIERRPLSGEREQKRRNSATRDPSSFYEVVFVEAGPPRSDPPGAGSTEHSS
jgi:hypothetical protein